VKIVVAVKQSASLDESAKLTDGGVDAAALEWDVNEWDLFAVEEAIALREAHDGEVAIVAIGGDEVREGLLTCLAMGADRAIHVEVPDDVAALDAIAVAHLLARVIGPESPDLVLCGVQSSDYAGAATGAALAGLLGLARVAVVRAIEADGEGGFTVSRELEGGLIERLRVVSPALLTVQTGINEPRYATLRGIRQAKDKPRMIVTIDDLGLDASGVVALAAVRHVGLDHPPASEGATMLDGDPTALATQIAAIIKARIGT
jgi:electron transfer flavoprotein beta subunit